MTPDIPTGQGADESALEQNLAEPTGSVVQALGALDGDLLILGAGGKMGPSLARLARRARNRAGSPGRVIAVSRFTDRGVSDALRRDGVETISGDLLDPPVLATLPDAPNVVYMAGQKFGTAAEPARTWAVNAVLPARVARRYARSRIVVFSTGNVYPYWPIGSEGPTETDPTGPIGEYAASALARERVFAFGSVRHGTPVAILRLNYAIEPRYGVLRDIADRVWAGQPVDLSMGRVNLIWQQDANAVALRALAHCASPPLVLNVTGRPAHAVRDLAEAFGRRFGRTPVYVGEAGATALLSNATLMEALFGPGEITPEEMIDRVAAWVERGGRSLGKPTRFERRDGTF